MLKKNRFSLIAVNLTLFSLASAMMPSRTLAQSNQPLFNKQQCIQKLVKQGLKSAQASVWCNYEEECLVQSQKEGLPLQSAKTVCECTISEFRNKYTTTQFKTITQQVDKNQKIARELRDTGEKCFEKILFE